MKKQVLIIVNPLCHQYRGWKRWLSIKDQVLKSFDCKVNELIIEKGIDLNSSMPVFLRDGENYIISAGGDGSIHYLVNTILKSGLQEKHDLVLGAIGLGSSNDFLKPFTSKIKNIPTRINPEVSASHDVGLATFYDSNNQYSEKYFIVNASVGLTATANWNFNNPGRVLQFLKSGFTPAAIMYAAINTIQKHHNINCRLQFNNTDTSIQLSNLNILKIPYVAGSFRYQQPLLPDDGKLGLNICKDMDRKKLLRTLFHLSHGRFINDQNKISVSTEAMHFSSQYPVIFECDGETEKASDIHISIIPGALKILTR